MTVKFSEIEYCPHRKRVWMILVDGLLSDEDLAAFSRNVEAVLSAIDGPFDIVASYASRTRPFEEVELQQIFAVYGAWRAMGLRTIARVAVDDRARDLVAPLDERAREVGLETMIFASREEADRHLDARVAIAA